MIKNTPGGEYYQRTIDNSLFSTSPRRASILPTAKQNTNENSFNKKSRIHHANSDPINALAISTPPTSSPSKTAGRFQVQNVDETKV